jgi:hypothetical protein
MRDIRLGDDIDDFCVRCKRVMNHNVVSVLNGAPAKVRCRTCHSDHDFRHEQAPPPKVDPRKQALFNEVLKKVSPDGDAAEVLAEVEVEPEGEIEEVEAEAEAEVEAEPDTEVEVETEEVDSPPKSKAKTAKTKPKVTVKVKAKGKK